MRLKALDVARLVIAWGTVVAFLIYGELWLSDLGSAIRSAGLFLWLIAVIAWWCRRRTKFLFATSCQAPRTHVPPSPFATACEKLTTAVRLAMGPRNQA